MSSTIFLPCLLSESYNYFKSIVSTFLKFQTSFIPLLAFQFKTFLLPFPVLNFHSTKLINKLQELGNMKQYLQNLFFTNLSVSLHLGLLSWVCAHLWEYKTCHILSTNTVIKQYFIVWKKHAWHSDANILTSSML